MPHAGTDYIQGHLLRTGTPYEAELLEAVSALLAPDDLVLDIGANIGNHTLFWASTVGCRVVSYEPQAELATALERSIERNHLGERVRVRQVALGRERARGEFAESIPGNLGAQRVTLGGGVGDVEVSRLDDEALGQRVALIKVDVEGMEIDVLAGGAELIERDRPMLCVECQDVASFDLVAAWMSERDYGYRASFNATPTHLFVPTSPTDRVANDVALGLVRSTYDLHEQIRQLRAARDAAALKYRELSARRGMSGPESGERRRSDSLQPQDVRSLQLAYDRVRSEALQYRADRDKRVDQLAQVRRRLNRVTRTRDQQRARIVRLERNPFVRAGKLVNRGRNKSVRIALALRRRVRPSRTSTSPASTGMPALVTRTYADAQKHDPAALERKAAVAEAAAAVLRTRLASGERLRVAAIVDDFTRRALEPECDLLNLHSATWRKDIERFDPHILFVESAWRGEQGSWHNTVPRLDENLRALLDHCRDRSIATAFWNKEDPVHFETFIHVAAEFDHVFTTDVDRVGPYEARLGHSRVRLLAFACQPRIHNPVETAARKDALVFAGGYYVRYPERMRDLRELVTGVSAVMPVEIFDRNLGTTHEDYSFPAEYEPYIVGTLASEDIDAAYKGYRYALNLNSVKSSQSMFARRALELLACNTVTISNYARGLKVLLGDLIPMSDSHEHVQRIISDLAADPDTTDRRRAMGLRKVLTEHTYGDRLSFVVATLTGEQPAQRRPLITVVTRVSSEEEAERAQARAAAQVGVDTRLTLVSDDEATRRWGSRRSIPVVASDDLDQRTAAELAAEGSAGIALLHIDDWYGPHYLLDLANAWLYCDAVVIGKGARYDVGSAGPARLDGVEYQSTTGLSARSSLIASTAATGLPATVFCDDEVLPGELSGFAVHRFDYCRSAAARGLDVDAQLSAWLPIETGLGHATIAERVQDMVIDVALTRSPVVMPDCLPARPRPKVRDLVHITPTEAGVAVVSALGEDATTLVWGEHGIDVAAVWPDRVARFGFTCTGSLSMHLVVRFLGSGGDVLSTVTRCAGVNHEVDVPEAATSARLGWKIKGAGHARVRDVALGPVPLDSPLELGGECPLIVTDQYPAYDALYRNAFVHARVRGYREAGLEVEVFRSQSGVPLTYREFEGVEVATGSVPALRDVIESGRHRTIIVHFLTRPIWEAVQRRAPGTRVLIWVHGAEVQPWWRRRFNHETAEGLETAKAVSDAKVAFWREVIDTAGPDVRFVFVSQYFADEVQQDLDRSLAPERYTVLHNPIDTEIFQYRPKDPGQRNRILSVRPYTTRVYANDLAVAAVLDLVQEPWFDELSFRFIGDGPLFDETLAPIRELPNVTIERGYLTHAEMADLHQDYGVMLIPSRSDTHGVSRDEAMSSGLVPVASAVAAVPEFLGDEEGFLAPPEDHHALAEAIVFLHRYPDEFLRRSEAAAKRVRRQADARIIIPQEIALIRGDS